MKNCSIVLTNVYLDIPVFTANQLRLMRKPKLLSTTGGNIDQTNGRIRINALKDISFALNHGEHLALIGHNGAGKTSLLKVIAGIYPQSRGDVTTSGSIGCLFELGLGVGVDMTGYEYIKFDSLAHGVAGDEWRKIAEDVATFTELDSYLDLPIRTYSEGMRARLTAALATAWRYDILLLDEGIGAGDQAFQEKFSRRISAFLEDAGLLVIASHNADLLRRYCTRGLLLARGEAQLMGSLGEALEHYAR